MKTIKIICKPVLLVALMIFSACEDLTDLNVSENGVAAERS